MKIVTIMSNNKLNFLNGHSEQLILYKVSFLGMHDLCRSLSQDDEVLDLETILEVVKYVYGWHRHFDFNISI